MKALTRSEKTLSLVVGSLAFLLFNLLLGSFFLNQNARLHADFIAKSDELKKLQVLYSERDRWGKREGWLQKKQPKLENENRAGVELLDQVKQIAKSNEVLLDNPGLGVLDKKPFYKSVPVNIETKSSWPQLIAFLRSIQQPDQFLVLEKANVQIDSGDPSAIRGKFTVSRWYLP